MSRRIKDYVKFTSAELLKYTESKRSCMKKINTDLHLNLPPSGLGNLKKAISETIATKKIGLYDQNLKGIVLDVRNIKVLGDAGAMRFDDPLIHLNIKADCYYFQPSIGSVVRGVVRHISSRQIGVIIFRVFSVTIRLNEQQNVNQLYGIEMDSEIEFRIKKFDLENVLPYIEGELVARDVPAVNIKKELKQEDEDEENEDGEEDFEANDEEPMTNGHKKNEDQDDWNELRFIIKTEKEDPVVEKKVSVTPLRGILKKSMPSPIVEKEVSFSVAETPVTNGKSKKKRKTKDIDLDESIELLLNKVKREKLVSESESSDK